MRHFYGVQGFQDSLSWTRYRIPDENASSNTILTVPDHKKGTENAEDMKRQKVPLELVALCWNASFRQLLQNGLTFPGGNVFSFFLLLSSSGGMSW